MFCESINWFLYAGNIGSQCVSPEVQVRTGYYLFSSKVKEGGKGCVYLSFLKQIEAIFPKVINIQIVLLWSFIVYNSKVLTFF